MYAIIKTGGKQYKVEPGTTFEIERIDGEPGDTVQLADSVLMVSKDGEVTVGTPTVDGASVELEIQEQVRSKKVVVFKMKRRKRYRRQRGHRQHHTVVTVKDITVG
jgi:large subunit ribosomal protein L21